MNNELSLKICNLGSGSRGNSTLVATEKCSILIDAGFSMRELVKRLNSINHPPEKINGIFLTHEHGDHIHCAFTFSRRYNVPIYANQKTMNAAHSRMELSAHSTIFKNNETFNLHDLSIKAVSISHDTVDPVMYTVANQNSKIAIATDMGEEDDLLLENLSGCNLILLESNHDLKMLNEGPYPELLKKRIRSSKGHLSNKQSSELFRKIKHSGLKHLILGHLSEHNNKPELALREFSSFIDQNLKIHVASQETCSEIFYI